MRQLERAADLQSIGKASLLQVDPDAEQQARRLAILQSNGPRRSLRWLQAAAQGYVIHRRRYARGQLPRWGHSGLEAALDHVSRELHCARTHGREASHRQKK